MLSFHCAQKVSSHTGGDFEKWSQLYCNVFLHYFLDNPGADCLCCSPCISGFGQVGPSLVRRNLWRVISQFFREALVNIHWEKLFVRLAFKFILVRVKGGSLAGSPRLV